MNPRYLVTGALGCIGAWVVERLLGRGDEVHVLDLPADPRRLRDLVGPPGLARVRFHEGDVTSFASVREVLSESRATRVIHLAGLQVPFCRANPVLGAQVNVVGTLNVFQAAHELDLERVVYASSAAVYGAEDGAAGPPNEATPCHPATHYGAFKLTNERNAATYFRDQGLSSVGLRPLTVYGIGRDQGMTSGPTTAIKAAALGRPWTVAFSGPTDFNFVEDTADAFLAAADELGPGAHVYNLHGETVEVSDFLERVTAALPAAGRVRLVADGPGLPLPPELDGSALEKALPNLPRTSLDAGIERTLAAFHKLARRGELDTRDLDPKA